MDSSEALVPESSCSTGTGLSSDPAGLHSFTPSSSAQPVSTSLDSKSYAETSPSFLVQNGQLPVSPLHQDTPVNATIPIPPPNSAQTLNMTSLSPAKHVLLSSRSHIDRFDVGLIGAQDLVLDLNAHRSAVTKLNLSHNCLGDAGIAHLFVFLSSPDGLRHRRSISELSLNSNSIGNEGFRYLAEYIRSSDALRTIWAQNNELTSDTETLTILANALNNSRVNLFSLTGNKDLGDMFIEQFLPLLHTPYLKELHLNTLRITQDSAPVIAEWITSRKAGGDRRCMLETFKCNGNSLGLKGVRQIVQAIEKGNWGLTKVEMYANQLGELEETDENDIVPETPMSNRSARIDAAWKETEVALRRVLLRNTHWKRQTEKEALSLLRYSRALLLRTKTPQPTPRGPTPVSFQTLPMELQLHIIALFAPTLSAAQRSRVYNYAADVSTLPPLLPSLRRGTGKSCLADPTSFLGVDVGFEVLGGGSGRCAEGKCMGVGNSLLCRREEERVKWLEVVGCSTYDPDTEE
ncbi:hypothetical protein SERLA73DRAFT_158311 [Serpula lacrymans var. lacrymans S7.3]|uniref:F-box domain-containing protein n=1 Tax=Serpula lacrymans var. lacrymans (strain S7.3) TaxID=936435 RepID=F8PKC8_SERL3|nr:hypothetical protein SERLA73DRAFT_158311 [Serpula lacrymans var. lacrymans S7.3]